jgi:hypothetical protein
MSFAYEDEGDDGFPSIGESVDDAFDQWGFDGNHGTDQPPEESLGSGRMGEPAAASFPILPLLDWGTRTPVSSVISGGIVPSHTSTGGVVALDPTIAESPLVVTPPLKRHRLTKKSQVVLQTSPVVRSSRPSLMELRRDPRLLLFQSLTSAEQKKVANRMRVKRCRLLASIKAGETITMRGRKWAADPQNDSWSTFVREWQMAFLEEELMATSIAPAEQGWCVQQLLQTPLPLSGEEKLLETKVLRHKSVLMTYQGDWGLFSLPGLVSSAPVDDAASALRDHPPVLALFREALAFFDDLKGDRHVSQYALSLELCARSWVDSHAIRLHLHAWILKETSTLGLDELRFKGSMAFVNFAAQSFLAGRGARSVASSYAGAFYLSVRKIGYVLAASTLEAFKHYVVKDYWVTTLYMLGKISGSVAKDLFLRCVTRAEANIRQLEYVQQQRESIEDAREQLENEHLILRSQRPFRTLPVVVAWLQHFSVADSRYKFLVLDGPSQTGKTRFARSLSCPPSSVFYADCSSGPPDLRDFSRRTHKLIVMDEMSPETAVSIKKVMQASNDGCVLGVSPTMQHAYKVNTFRTRIVVCTNTWASRMGSLDRVQQEWLSANSYYVFVESPLYLPGH